MAIVHIAGAGMAGLSAAVQLVRAGYRVALHESAGHAGGRCRSFHDATLDRVIDNGNHLLLSGNRSVMGLLDIVGARDRLRSAPEAAFPFIDLADGRRWTVGPVGGRLPFWLLDPARRAPDSRLADYLAGLRLWRAGNRTVAECLGDTGGAWKRFWEPLSIAVLNTRPEEAAAALLWPVLVETFGRGGRACRPCIARNGLSDALVDPVVDWLGRQGAEVRFNARLRGLEVADGLVRALDFGAERIALGPEDRLVVALPPGATGELFPGLAVPDDFRPIVNAHFRLAAPPARSGNDDMVFLGMIGGVADWLFLRHDIVSVTVSAATALVTLPVAETAARLWRDVARALDLPTDPVPPCRVIRERRATFAQTPSMLARRPGPASPSANAFLAGDWTGTGLPATIEGAVRSGENAARALIRASRDRPPAPPDPD